MGYHYRKEREKSLSQHHKATLLSPHHPSLDPLPPKLARQSRKNDAKLRVQLDEERVAAHDLRQALRAHDVAADARIPVGIDLLGAEKARHIGEARRRRRCRPRRRAVRAVLRGRETGAEGAQGRRQRRRGDGGGGALSRRGGLAVEHGVGERDDAGGDGLEGLGDGHHGVADLPAVAAAQRQQRVGAAAAPRPRVRQPEHVRDCVPRDRVAEVQRAGRRAPWQVFAGQGADAGAPQEGVGGGGGGLPRRDVGEVVSVGGVGYG